jgi:hypothetical protein
MFEIFKAFFQSAASSASTFLAETTWDEAVMWGIFAFALFVALLIVL